MFEHLFFIYQNCFLTIIFVKIIIFYYFIMSYPYRIHVLVFFNLPCRIPLSVSLLPRFIWHLANFNRKNTSFSMKSKKSSFQNDKQIIINPFLRENDSTLTDKFIDEVVVIC